MPLRVNPHSEEARLFGPLSKRREVNIRWRHFSAEWRKVWPPLEVQVSSAGVDNSTDISKVSSAGIRPMPLQGLGLLEEASALAQPPNTEKTSGEDQSNSVRPYTLRQFRPFDNVDESAARWYRRRYRELLARIPILKYSASSKPKSTTGSYEVSPPPNALANAYRSLPERWPEADEDELTWLDNAPKK